MQCALEEVGIQLSVSDIKNKIKNLSKEYRWKPVSNVNKYYLNCDSIVNKPLEADSKPFIWKREATLLLISLYEKHLEEFESNTSTKKQVWKYISHELSTHGNAVTWEQCDTKWKTLKKHYKKIKDLNNKSGNNRVDWKYYYVMDNILSLRPEICPLSTCIISNTELTINYSEDEKMDATLKTSPDTLRKCLSTKRKKLDDREKNKQKRHEEKMERQDKFLNLMEKLLEKFLILGLKYI